MSTLVTDLNTLKTARDNMQNAFANKGVIVTKDIRTYANAITNIPSGGGSGDVKLFDTVEHMQADPNPSEGDLAVVYREELTAVTAESEFDSCTFPNEVVLDEAFTGDIYGSFRAVDDSSGYFDGMIEMSSSGFRFDGYGESSEIRVEYESEDGITYTRTDGGDALQEFGVIIKWGDYGEGFNSVIGNFMKIGENYFEGLYKYVSKSDDNYILSFTDIINTGSDISTTVENINISDIIGIIRQIISENALDHMTVTCVITNGTVVLYTLGASSGGTAHQYVYAPDIAVDDNQGYILHSNIAGGIRDGISKITVNLEQQTYVVTTLTHSTSIFDREYGDTFDLSSTVFFVGIDADNQIFYPNIYGYFGSNLRKTLLTLIGNIAEYCINSAQLDATSDYVYEKTFYGKNGVETGNLATNVSNSFADIEAELYYKIHQKYEDMPVRVLDDTSIKFISNNIYGIPVKKNGIPLLDTSNVTNMSTVFFGCKNLKEIPLLDTANVTNMDRTFTSCFNLVTVAPINTSKVTDMYGTFSGCINLITIHNLDTSNVTNMYETFRSCSNLKDLPTLNTSLVTTMNNTFRNCSNLETINLTDTHNVVNMDSIFSGCSKLKSISTLNTCNIINMTTMFDNCTNLVDIPVLNTVNTKKIYYSFRNCPNLSNDSLNNILRMCASATKVTTTSYKSLTYIGLSQEQANICKTLSNYSAFTSAGWTTGY